MAEFPALPLWTDAYIGDTTHLTTIEHGAYLLLLISMWRTAGCNLPNDDRLLAKIVRCTPAQWRRLKPSLMPFFKVIDDHIEQGRLTDERNAVKRNSKRQSDKAKSRWLKNNETTDAAGMPRECRPDASLTLTHTVAKATAAEGVPSISEVLWSRGVPYLVRHGVKEKQARSLIGRWRKESGDAAVFEALKRAAGEGAAEPVAFITAVLKPKPSSDAQKLEAWGIKEHDPDAERIGERPQHRDTPLGAGAADMPRVQPHAEGFAQEDPLPFGDDDGGWTASALPSLRLVGGCAV